MQSYKLLRCELHTKMALFPQLSCRLACERQQFSATVFQTKQQLFYLLYRLSRILQYPQVHSKRMVFNQSACLGWELTWFVLQSEPMISGKGFKRCIGCPSILCGFLRRPTLISLHTVCYSKETITVNSLLWELPALSICHLLHKLSGRPHRVNECNLRHFSLSNAC